MTSAFEGQLTVQENRFRDEVRTFLDENLNPDLRRAGRMITWAFSDFEQGRIWQKILHGRGWGAPSWPIQFGGTGWSPVQHFIYEIECIRASAPVPYFLGTMLCGPCIMAFGTAEQQSYYLPSIISGDHWWAQGFSEPGCGSDLASLQLRADPDGDSYLLNGSKIWTSYAHHASHIFCLVRTSSTGRKQAGISFLLIDMKTQGITVRPIRNIAGEHEFNQVYFDNVRVPQGNRLGKENEGWQVARHLLRFEHGGGGRVGGEMRRRLAWVTEIATMESDGRGGRLIEDADFSRRLAEAALGVEAIEFAGNQALAALRTGDAPPAAIPLLRIRQREVGQKLTELGMEAMAQYGAPFQPDALRVLDPASPVGPDYGLLAMPFYLAHRAATIAGGTPEVQRNNLAKTLLGL